MKNITITTPENIEVEYTLADLASRTAAASIDMLIISAVSALILIALIFVNWLAPNFWSNYYGWILGITFFVLAVFIYGYFIVLELTMNGKTFGKKLLKLRTIRNNGQPVTFKHSAIRNLIRLFIDMTGIGAIVMFFSKQHKRVGDMLASTIVICEKKAELPAYLETFDEEYSKFVQYLNKEEKDILSDYLARKNDYDNGNELKEKLYEYLIDKFKELDILDQWESYIEEIIK